MEVRVLIFDLDDTLYPELSFVKSGFKSVADYLFKIKKINNRNKAYQKMISVLKEKGRGEVFDLLLKSEKIYSKKLVKKCLSIYRLHFPVIKLYPGVLGLFRRMKKYPIYIVTDGNKIVQANKIKALHLEKYVKKSFITYRHGIHASKPSLHCFDLIRQHEKCSYQEMVYIADNPSKDFVNNRLAGIRTVRVLTGNYAGTKADSGYDAEIKIKKVADFKPVILKQKRPRL